MSNNITPKILQELYLRGENLNAFLKERSDRDSNTEEIIEVSYDLQTGSYIEQMRDPDFLKFKKGYAKELASIIVKLCSPASVLEAGVGEATTLSGVVQHLASSRINYYGFDISWSRVAYARNWLFENKLNDIHLCTGSLFNMPYADNSIDVVYTSHSMEPNGGNEIPILKELMRVTGKYLILLEPGYEFANVQGKKRMEFHGYVRNLKQRCIELGYKVLRHELFPLSTRGSNPTAITIVEKNQCNGTIIADSVLACPRYKTELIEYDDYCFSSEALMAYPKLLGMPCLRIENGIVASKLLEILG